MPLKLARLSRGSLLSPDPGTSLMVIEPPAFFEEYKRSYTPWLTVTTMDRNLIANTDAVSGQDEIIFYLGSHDQSHPTLFEWVNPPISMARKRSIRRVHEVLWRGSVFRVKSDHLSKFCSRYKNKVKKNDH
jgi:hypothetical protein